MEIQEFTECPICFCSTLEFNIICQCGHSICPTCWFKIKHSCPFCQNAKLPMKVNDLSRHKIIGNLLYIFYSTMKIGTMVDAKDCDGRWLEGRIVELDKNKAKVHFFGWSKKWDEWIVLSKEKLLPHAFYSSNWFDTIDCEDVIEFKLEFYKQKPKWYRGMIIELHNKFIRVSCKERNQIIKIKRDRDHICRIGTHVPRKNKK